MHILVIIVLVSMQRLHIMVSFLLTVIYIITILSLPFLSIIEEPFLMTMD